MFEDSAAGDGGRILEWEMGLPSADDLTPLSQSLISPELASAFRISPESSQSILDVHLASQDTVSSLRRLRSLPPLPAAAAAADSIVIEADDPAGTVSSSVDDESSSRVLKRPRLVWTPQLHKRFVDVLAHLGVEKAVPKAIMELMNVEGLTRENVASHLQKYRLYVKRTQGLSNEGPSSSDPLFASAPMVQSIHESSVPVVYASLPMIPMPVFGMDCQQGYQGSGGYNGYEMHHPYGGFAERPRDWSGGSKSGFA